MDAISEPVFQAPFNWFYPWIGIILTVVLAHIYIESSRSVRLGRKIPGPPTLPIIGNALLVLRFKPEEVIPLLLKNDVYGNVVRIIGGSKLFVIIVDPRDIEIILGSSIHVEKGPEYSWFKPWLGEGLLISSGEKWKTHRKMIAPTFHWNILKTFVPLFYENSREVIRKMGREVGHEFDVHHYMCDVTVSILLDTAMGMHDRDTKRRGVTYAKAVMDLCNIIQRRQYNMFLRHDLIFRFNEMAKKQKELLGIIHDITNRVVRRRKAGYSSNDVNIDDQLKISIEQDNIEKNPKSNYSSMRYIRDDLDDIDDNDVGEKKRLAFLDMLLAIERSGDKLTEKEVADEVTTIMFEGHDTTAAASSFVLSLLGTHQDIQAKVWEELYGIFQNSDRQCTFQDTVEMKYLERVIMETLRKYPPVPLIGRELQEDVKLVTGDYIVPKGTAIGIPILKVHRLEQYYPNPEIFDPDNFLPERMQTRHYYSFIPFSAGPRSCVGRKYAMLKLKVLLSTILRKYTILSDVREEDYQLQGDIILKRVDGCRIKIEPRQMH